MFEEMTADEYLQEFYRQYHNPEWAVEMNNPPHEEDGFNVVPVNRSEPVIARCDNSLDALVIAMALNVLRAGGHQ